VLHPGFSLGLFFDPEDEGDMFTRNIGSISADYTALYPKRPKHILQYNPGGRRDEGRPRKRFLCNLFAVY
jgi:hypothetical protein